VNYPEFYPALFRVMLPETALEVAALIVLVVDLALLRCWESRDVSPACG
jgi:hypothetical protein